MAIDPTTECVGNRRCKIRSLLCWLPFPLHDKLTTTMLFSQESPVAKPLISHTSLPSSPKSPYMHTVFLAFTEVTTHKPGHIHVQGKQLLPSNYYYTFFFTLLSSTFSRSFVERDKQKKPTGLYITSAAALFCQVQYRLETRLWSKRWNIRWFQESAHGHGLGRKKKKRKKILFRVHPKIFHHVTSTLNGWTFAWSIKHKLKNN